MRADPHYTEAAAALRSLFAVLHEEIHAPLRPCHATVAFGQEPPPTDALFEAVKEIVETKEIVKTLLHVAIPKRHATLPLSPVSQGLAKQLRHEQRHDTSYKGGDESHENLIAIPRQKVIRRGRKAYH